MRYLMIAALMAVFSCPALAQSWCVDRTRLMDELARDFGERQVGIGLINKELIAELMISEDEKTWTIIVTASNGVGCIIAAGESWQSTPPDATGTDSRLRPPE